MKLSPSFEWTVIDTDSSKLKLIQASSQKEAVRKAYNNYGLVPKRTDHARPRTGDTTLMGKDEYRDWLERHLNL